MKYIKEYGKNKSDLNTYYRVGKILSEAGKHNNNISEKILKQLIMEDIDNFLLELGDGFSYIGSEYKKI